MKNVKNLFVIILKNSSKPDRVACGLLVQLINLSNKKFLQFYLQSSINSSFFKTFDLMREFQWTFFVFNFTCLFRFPFER